MRVLIQSLGSAGDVHPFIAIGQALRDRGHDVVLLSNGLFADAVEAAGLSFVETGTAEEFQATAAKPELWHPTKGLDLVLDEGVFPSLEPTIDLLRQHLTDDTILVGSTLGFAARLVSELEDRPLATVHLAPTAFRTAHRMPVLPGMPAGPSSPRWLKRLSWWLIRKITDGKIAPRLNSTRRRLGLPPVSDVFFDWLHSPQRVLATWPEWFAPAQPDWPPQARHVGFCLHDRDGHAAVPDDLLDWLTGDAPPILFTHGSAQLHGQGFFATAVETARRLGRRALLVASRRESLPAELPAGMRHEAYLPFSRVLPHCAALVSHGGVGTCAQALAAGVPHLVVPMAFDQFDNASRLVELGVGDCLPVRRLTTDRAVAALRPLLSRTEDVRARCAEGAPTLRGETRVAEELETLHGG